MQDAYESRFGIFNHATNKSRPLASVAMFPSEDTVAATALYDAYEEYARNGYKEIWGLSVGEFLNQPRYIVEMMREITIQVMKRKSSALDEVKANLLE